MSRLFLLALLLLSPALAQNPPGPLPAPLPTVQADITGGGQQYAVLSAGAAWQSVELPLVDVGTLGRSTLKLSAPGLSLKVTGSKLSSDGCKLQLALDVQRASGFQNGVTTFTLQDAAGQGLTFRLSVY